jgi:sugar lactone lactonase YvrE
VVVDAAGDLFIADTYNNRIRKVTPNGTITTVAGIGQFGFYGDGGPATRAELYLPTGVALDGEGNLFIADTENNLIRQVAPDGTITTVAGGGNSVALGDGGPATSALLSLPMAVAVDVAGNLFIADYTNYRVRKVSLSGIITSVAGNGQFSYSGDGGLATSRTPC